MGKGIKMSFVLDRIKAQLEKYRPEEAKDITVIHANGKLKNRLRMAEKAEKYAVIQYALKTTRNPDKKDWAPLWKGAKVVWSYYDLGLSNSYYAPLGVDSGAFRLKKRVREYKIMTVGGGYLQESVRECYYATKEVKGKFAHVGPDLGRKDIAAYTNISDRQLMELYNRSEYVSGLRRHEGFELPVLEGLLCGAMPIVFDLPCYHKWYDGLAVFIPETNRAQIIVDLKKILQNKPKPVTKDVINYVKSTFNWEKLVKGFWERCLDG